MKFIGKLLLYILIALLVVIAGLYFLLQTRWGAEHISAWVSENSDYHLAFGAMDHRFSAPSQSCWRMSRLVVMASPRPWWPKVSTLR